MEHHLLTFYHRTKWSIFQRYVYNTPISPLFHRPIVYPIIYPMIFPMISHYIPKCSIMFHHCPLIFHCFSIVYWRVTIHPLVINLSPLRDVHQPSPKVAMDQLFSWAMFNSYLLNNQRLRSLNSIKSVDDHL